MRSIVSTTLVATASLVLAATPAAAQGGGAASGGSANASASAAANASADAGVSAIRTQYQPVLRYLTAAAERIPDSLYSYRPTANVRTIGELIAHISNFHNLGCATALGESNPSQEDFEKTRTTKAAIAEALRTSAAVCERAFAQSDAAAGGTVKLFGRDRSRMAVLAMVMGHDWEHYGNLVTYMRMVGLVPPSSQQ